MLEEKSDGQGVHHSNGMVGHSWVSARPNTTTKQTVTCNTTFLFHWHKQFICSDPTVTIFPPGHTVLSVVLHCSTTVDMNQTTRNPIYTLYVLIFDSSRSTTILKTWLYAVILHFTLSLKVQILQALLISFSEESAKKKRKRLLHVRTR